MKKLFVILAALLLSEIGMAQNGFYIGYENGGLFDKYHYVNNKGFSLTQSSIGGLLGGYFGYKQESYNLEIGIYEYNSYSPCVKYDYISGKVKKSLSMAGGTDNLVIPLRFGKEFQFANQRLYLKPEFAFNTIISLDYSEGQPTSGWGENLSNPIWPVNSADSTIANGHVPSMLNFGIESSLSFGYRFKKKADVYLKGSYMANFNPTYYETITHYSTAEIVNATSVRENAFMLQIGVKYYFAKRDK